MPLRLKRIGFLALLAVFIIILFSANYHCALAQEKDGKTAPKTEKSIMPLVTFVEIGSVNCIPCRAMQPIMKAVEEEFGEQVNVVFHDVWTKGNNAAYNIRNSAGFWMDGKSFSSRSYHQQRDGSEAVQIVDSYLLTYHRLRNCCVGFCSLSDNFRPPYIASLIVGFIDGRPRKSFCSFIALWIRHSHYDWSNWPDHGTCRAYAGRHWRLRQLFSGNCFFCGRPQFARHSASAFHGGWSKS